MPQTTGSGGAAASAAAAGITLLIPTLCPGGAERVMTDMASYWTQHGRPVCLITFDASPSPFTLHPGVRRLALRDLRIPKAEDIPPLLCWPHEAANVQRLRQALALAGHKAVLSFLPRMNMRALLAAQAAGGDAYRVVVCERTHAPMMPLGEKDEALRRTLYPLAHRVVCLTRYTRDTWAKNVVPLRKLRVIPNAFVPRVPHVDKTPINIPEQYALAAGRLSHEKGFDRLLNAWCAVHTAHPALRLVIAGDGPECEALRAQAHSLGLGGSVLFQGFVSDMDSLLRGARFFVLPSRFEGFPNALLEAMSAGLACAAFDCLTGPGEIIHHEENGLLVPPDNTEALTSALLALADDTALRARLGAAARTVRTRYGRGRIMRLWEKALGLPAG